MRNAKLLEVITLLIVNWIMQDLANFVVTLVNCSNFYYTGIKRIFLVTYFTYKISDVHYLFTRAHISQVVGFCRWQFHLILLPGYLHDPT